MTANRAHEFFQAAFRPQWVNLAPKVLGEEEEVLDGQTAKLWSLVLSSRHVPHRVRQRPAAEGGGHVLEAQPWFAQRAVEEIRLYRAENRPDANFVIADLRPVSGLEPTIGVMAAMLLFYWLYTRAYPALGLFPRMWLEVGSAEAARILSGEWWRTITALTLHGDGAHVMGNALIGGVFVWLVARRLGSGLTWMLVLGAGGVGNLINAWVLGPPHNSIGFSTASFAAAGLLAAITPFGVGGGRHGFGRGSLLQRGYRFLKSALIPVSAGLGLLAMLGAGKETDLGAHLFGFVAGLGFGVLAGGVVTRFGVPGKRMNAGLFAVAVMIPVLAWWVAFAGR